MRIPLSFWLGGALLFVFSLTSFAAKAPEKEWTVLVFLNGNNNLDSFGKINVKQMEQVGSTDDINLVVQWASYRSSTTKRILVQKDTGPAVTSPVVQDLPRVDMGDYHALIDFLKWGIENYPAKHYFVDVWNHGGGWHRGMSFHTDNISYDEYSGHSISTPELGVAMAVAANMIGHKVDIYGSDACLMAMAEVATEMSDSVRVFVGSEETEPGAGWPYDKFLEHWNGRPRANASEVGAMLAEEYKKSFQSSGAADEREVTMSVMHLDAMDALDQAITELAGEISKLSKDDQEKFVTAAGQALKFAFDDYIDLADLTDQVESVLPDLSTTTASVREAVSELVSRNEVTAKFSKAKGISIWMPIKSSVYTAHVKEYQQLKFARTGWGAVLDQLLKQ